MTAPATVAAVIVTVAPQCPLRAIVHAVWARTTAISSHGSSGMGSRTRRVSSMPRIQALDRARACPTADARFHACVV